MPARGLHESRCAAAELADSWPRTGRRLRIIHRGWRRTWCGPRRLFPGSPRVRIPACPREHPGRWREQPSPSSARRPAAEDAPAGRLVRRQDVPCAWVALDEEDDDPRRLWAAVLGALVACPAVPASAGYAAWSCRARGGRRLPHRRAGGARCSAGARPARAGRRAPSPQHGTLHGLQLLLRHRLSTVRLVLASQVDPALPVARLRLEQRLCEVRTAQLAFSAEETATLAERCGLRLTARQTADLRAHADGWAAGIGSLPCRCATTLPRSSSSQPSPATSARGRLPRR